MTKRILTASLSVLLGVLLTACGGDSGTAPTPAPTPTPPTRAQVQLNVDPNPQTAEYQGNGWWRFKVNLEFVETAGVGFTINSIRTTLTSRATGGILYDNEEAIVEYVGPRGRKVMQFSSAHYYTMYGLSGAVDAKFVVSITDDKGNPLTVSNQATILRHTEEAVELQ
ncbi:MAG: hypothetical protein LJF15_05295 [Acidobacteria bacterium]|nr:hypothetical protein [Acidobacteriota bacterium]